MPRNFQGLMCYHEIGAVQTLLHSALRNPALRGGACDGGKENLDVGG